MNNGSQNGDMSPAEVRTGRILNGVAIAGGLNAMRMAGNEFRHARKLTPAAAQARVSGNRVLSRVSQTKGFKALARHPKATAIGLAGGMMALHGSELVGDAISARSLRNQSKNMNQGGVPVKINSSENGITKAYVSPISRTTGRGVNIEKAYRRFDPEADRQRRLGAYAGVGLGAGIGLGAASHQSFSRHYPNAGAKIAQAMKAKKFRKPAALGAAALASTTLGAAAYRRGVSERNNPWN